MTTLNYLELPQTPYIPRAPQLSEQLLAKTADTYERQSQDTFGEMDAMDELALNTQANLTGLGETDKAKLAQIQNVTQAQMSEYVDKYGARGALRYVKQAAKRFKSATVPFIEGSQKRAATFKAIEESKADPEAKKHARYLASKRMGDSIFDEEGNLNEYSTQDIEDVLANYKDYTTFIDAAIKSIDSVTTQNFISKDGKSILDINGIPIAEASTYAMIESSGVTPNRAQTVAVAKLLTDNQTKAQLEMAVKALQDQGAFDKFSSVDEKGEKLNHFSTTRQDIEVEYQEDGKIKKKTINVSPIEYLAMQKVAPSLNAVGVSTKLHSPKLSNIDAMTGGRGVKQTFTNETFNHSVRLKNEGYGGASDWYNVKGTKLKELDSQYTALNEDFGKIAKDKGFDIKGLLVDDSNTGEKVLDETKAASKDPDIRLRVYMLNNVIREQQALEAEKKEIQDVAKGQLLTYIEKLNANITNKEDKLPTDFEIDAGGNLIDEDGKSLKKLGSSVINSVTGQPYPISNHKYSGLQEKFDEFASKKVKSLKPKEEFRETIGVFLSPDSPQFKLLTTRTVNDIARTGTVTMNGELQDPSDLTGHSVIGVPKFVLNGNDNKPTLVLEVTDGKAEKTIEYTGEYAMSVARNYATSENRNLYTKNQLYGLLGTDIKPTKRVLTGQILQQLGLTDVNGKSPIKDFTIERNKAASSLGKTIFILKDKDGKAVMDSYNYDDFFLTFSKEASK